MTDFLHRQHLQRVWDGNAAMKRIAIDNSRFNPVASSSLDLCPGHVTDPISLEERMASFLEKQDREKGVYFPQKEGKATRYEGKTIVYEYWPDALFNYQKEYSQGSDEELRNFIEEHFHVIHRY